MRRSDGGFRSRRKSRRLRTLAKANFGAPHLQRHNCNHLGQPSRSTQMVPNGNSLGYFPKPWAANPGATTWLGQVIRASSRRARWRPRHSSASTGDLQSPRTTELARTRLALLARPRRRPYGSRFILSPPRLTDCGHHLLMRACEARSIVANEPFCIHMKGIHMQRSRSPLPPSSTRRPFEAVIRLGSFRGLCGDTSSLAGGAQPPDPFPGEILPRHAPCENNKPRGRARNRNVCHDLHSTAKLLPRPSDVCWQYGRPLRRAQHHWNRL
jgi:hypothetical protein